MRLPLRWRTAWNQHPWVRVLKGLRPYRTAVVISILCAIGVGVSYAGSLAAVMPAMKIFISVEGVHGWANRTGAQDRLQSSLLDLDTVIRKGGEADLVILKPMNAASPVADLVAGDRITRVKLLGPDQAVHLTNKSPALSDSTRWQDMVALLALPTSGEKVELTVATARGTSTRQVTLAGVPWFRGLLPRVVQHLPENPTQSLIWVMVVLVSITGIQGIFRYWQQRLGSVVAIRVVNDIRRRAFDRVIRFPIGYVGKKGTSDLTSRLTQDCQMLIDGLVMTLGKSVQEPVKAVAAAAFALWLNWWLSVLVILIVPVMAVVIRFISKRLRKHSRRTMEGSSRILGVIEETLGGLKVVKAYSAEGYERRRFARVNTQFLDQQQRMIHYASLSRPLLEIIETVLVSVPFLLAAWLVLNGKGVNRESFFLLLGCFVAILEPLRKLGDVNSRLQQANAAAVRVFEVIDEPVELNYDHAMPRLAPHRRSIEFADITFRYPGHEETVLSNVSLSVKHGQTVAVVGGNGSGKTTLMSLLPRLYTPAAGKILIDGVDISTVSLRSLRRQIGLVTQDAVLFADTLFANIAYGTRHASAGQVTDASRRAFADEFIRTFPEGYETKVGEHGVRLSGGQKQRVAIARAILHDPAILILDEAMSQIDSDSEMKISQALREFAKDRTTFVIAHRFSTVVTADLICCLDHGRVVGTGTHAELLATCPPYRRLYETQFRDSPAEAVMTS